jgi:hypothetical protein
MRYLLICLVLIASSAFAQDKAKPEDVKSVDAIVAALYDVISGPIGKERDWERMRSLFASDAAMSVVGTSRTGTGYRRALTVEDYIKASGPFLKEKGFYEKEIARKVEVFGGIAHVFSTYESRWKPDDAKPFERGINSIQLWSDGKRWWVQTVMWQGESEKSPLPAKYLPGG